MSEDAPSRPEAQPPVDEQREFAARSGLRFPLLSDPDRKLAEALTLPTFTVAGQAFYKRATLIAKRERIVKVFYPVFPPQQNAADVVDWLENNPGHVTDVAAAEQRE